MAQVSRRCVDVIGRLNGYLIGGGWGLRSDAARRVQGPKAITRVEVKPYDKAKSYANNVVLSLPQ